MSEQAAALTDTEITPELETKFFENEGEVPELAVEETEETQKETKAEPEEKQEDKPDKTVPYGALHEERMRRKEATEQNQQLTSKVASMESRFQQILEKSKDQPPSFEEDPANALKHENTQLKQRLDQYDQRFTQQDEQQKAYQEQQAFVTKYQAAAADFTQTNPDFQEAYTHLVNNRLAELQSVGYTPQEASRIASDEEAMIVGRAFEDNVNPAERVYQLAKGRGYQKADDSEKMDALQKGLQASKTLSNAGGKTSSEVTLESLANMSDEEFEKADWDTLISQ